MPAERRAQVIAVRPGSTGSYREEPDCSAEAAENAQLCPVLDKGHQR